jgi:hypothetical protein
MYLTHKTCWTWYCNFSVDTTTVGRYPLCTWQHVVFAQWCSNTSGCMGVVRDALCWMLDRPQSQGSRVVATTVTRPQSNTLYLRSSMKNVVYANIAETRQQLQQRTQDAANKIHTTPEVSKPCSGIVLTCIHDDGQHFKHFFTCVTTKFSLS